MLANTPYHMQATVKFNSGLTFTDIDHTFTTTALPAAKIPSLTASTTPGMTPQSGIELLELNAVTKAARFEWPRPTSLGTSYGDTIQDLLSRVVRDLVKLLPNGHFLMGFGSQPDGLDSTIQEVDLGNNVIWQMTAAQLNQALAAATCAGCNVTVVGTHHDIAILPNGHLLVIAAQAKGGNRIDGLPQPGNRHGGCDHRS